MKYNKGEKIMIKVIPVSCLYSCFFKDLKPGKYAVANMKEQKIVQIIEILPKPKNLDLFIEYEIKEEGKENIEGDNDENHT